MGYRFTTMRALWCVWCGCRCGCVSVCLWMREGKKNHRNATETNQFFVGIFLHAHFWILMKNVRMRIILSCLAALSENQQICEWINERAFFMHFFCCSLGRAMRLRVLTTHYSQHTHRTQNTYHPCANCAHEKANKRALLFVFCCGVWYDWLLYVVGTIFCMLVEHWIWMNCSKNIVANLLFTNELVRLWKTLIFVKKKWKNSIENYWNLSKNSRDPGVDWKPISIAFVRHLWKSENCECNTIYFPLILFSIKFYLLNLCARMCAWKCVCISSFKVHNEFCGRQTKLHTYRIAHRICIVCILYIDANIE